MDPKVVIATIDNGCHYFSVVFHKGRVTILRIDDQYDEVADQQISTVLEPAIFNYQASEVWIHSERIDAHVAADRLVEDIYDLENGLAVGGSCLTRVHSSLTYYLICAEVVRFEALAPIVRFSTIIGNSCCPKPWAVDELGNVYDLVDMAIVQASPKLQAQLDDEFFDLEDWSFDCTIEYTDPTSGKFYRFWVDADEPPEQIWDRCVQNDDGDEPPCFLELDKALFCKIVTEHYAKDVRIRIEHGHLFKILDGETVVSAHRRETKRL